MGMLWGSQNMVGKAGQKKRAGRRLLGVQLLFTEAGMLREEPANTSGAATREGCSRASMLAHAGRPSNQKPRIFSQCPTAAAWEQKHEIGVQECFQWQGHEPAASIQRHTCACKSKGKVCQQVGWRASCGVSPSAHAGMLLLFLPKVAEKKEGGCRKLFFGVGVVPQQTAQWWVAGRKFCPGEGRVVGRVRNKVSKVCEG